MQIVYFTVTAVLLYVLSDWILKQIEKKRGQPLPNRSIIFFVIIMVLAVGSFKAIEYLVGQPGI